MQFELNETVEIDCSNEQGVVIARMESLAEQDKYLILYQRADGVGVMNWWHESLLSPVSDED